MITRQPRPSRRHVRSLALVAAGVVVGFPLLLAWALRFVPANHGAIMRGIQPLATAIAGVARGQTSLGRLLDRRRRRQRDGGRLRRVLWRRPSRR
ncbi:hypothetical protein [Kallotenue papyrolyticum]|uniref:hypothetical protein n=1 Tax=Kallotenue papyrolyticum TaxID=1325125 RepID=UPI003B833852